MIQQQRFLIGLMIAIRTFSHKGKKARFRTFKNLDNDKNPRSKDRRSVYGIPSKLLSYLIIDGATKKTRRLPHDEALYEQIVGTNPEKDMRTSISDACKQINDNIQRNCGLENFVICEQDIVYIAPLYLP
jgi:hypothetical protein